MIGRTWQESVMASPAVGVSLLPKLVCPVCSPAYAALLSSLGLGLIATTYLLPITVGFLAVALAAVVFRASSRRAFCPGESRPPKAWRRSAATHLRPDL